MYRLLIRCIIRLRSGLRLIKHIHLALKDLDELVNVRVRALSDKGNIFFIRTTIGTFDFRRTYDVMLLLLGSVEPSEEESCTLSLLTAIGTTQIQKDVRVLMKEFLNNTDDGLSNLHITWRLGMLRVCQIKPIGRKIRIGVLVKGYDVFDIMVCPKMQTTMKLSHGVW